MIGLTGNWAFSAEQLSSRPASAAINGKKTINASVRSIALVEKNPRSNQFTTPDGCKVAERELCACPSLLEEQLFS